MIELIVFPSLPIDYLMVGWLFYEEDVVCRVGCASFVDWVLGR